MRKQIVEPIKQFRKEKIELKVNKKALTSVVDHIFNLFFPICQTVRQGKTCDQIVDDSYNIMVENLENLPQIAQAETRVSQFFSRLPEIQKALYEDAQAFFKNDPAANSVEEVILSYPGFYALAVHRLAHELYQLQVPIVPRLWAEYAHTQGGIDIHPGATIGKRFFLDHGTGTVIGETCIIGNDVKIYQNVTLGALHVGKSMEHAKRHPTVQDNVIIYSGATILGGATIIGHDSTIGGNVWVTRSVPPHTLVYYSSEMQHKVLKKNGDFIDFSI